MCKFHVRRHNLHATWTRPSNRQTEGTYFIQGVLQDRLCLIPLALGHVTRGLAVQQDQSGRVFISHLLEDVEGVLQLLSSLFTQLMITDLFILGGKSLKSAASQHYSQQPGSPRPWPAESAWHLHPAPASSSAPSCTGVNTHLLKVPHHTVIVSQKHKVRKLIQKN